jgi:hypothetical protein
MFLPQRLVKQLRYFRVSYEQKMEMPKMDRYDQGLLDKQMRNLTPPRKDGVIAVLLALMFLVGMALGSVLSAYKNEPTQIAGVQTNPDKISDAAPRSALNTPGT